MISPYDPVGLIRSMFAETNPPPEEKSGSANIKSPPVTLPPVEASPKLLPTTTPAEKDARKAVGAYLAAKRELSAAQADTPLSGQEKGKSISSLEQQVAILRPAALALSNSNYARAKEMRENAARHWKAADEAWKKAPDLKNWTAREAAESAYRAADGDVVDADRLRGQARETKRSSAQDADIARNVANSRANGPAHVQSPSEHADNVESYQAAAQFSVWQWETASADAARGGDAEEIEKCRVGLDDARFCLKVALEMK
jgi:hypothetical protein